MRHLTSLAFLLILILLLPLHASGQWSNKTIEIVSGNKILSGYLQLSYNNITRNLDSARFYGEKALNRALKEKNKPASCLAYSLLARINLLTPDYARALNCIDSAISINDNLKIPALDAYIKYVTAVKFLMLDKKKETIDEATRATLIYEQLKDSAGMASLYKIIGMLYFSSAEPGDLEKARLYFFKTLGIQNHPANYSRIGSVYANIGNVFFKLKEYDSANWYMRKAIWYNRKNNNLIWLATDYVRLGEIKSAFGQYDSAEYYLMLAGKYFTHPNDQALYYISRGKIARKRKQYETARDLYNRAYTLAREYNNVNTLMQAIEEIIETAERVNDDKTAIRYLKEYARLKDTLSAAENMPATSLLEMQREHYIKTRQMEVEKEKIAVASQRKNLYIVFLAVFSLLTILTSVVVIYFLKLRQRAISLEKARLDSAIEFKNKEMTMTLMSVIKRNEMMSGIRQQILNIGTDDAHNDPRAGLKRIAQEIKEISNEEIWEEFELRFQQVHSDFHKNLIKKHPGLTAGDMRLCALLRLNLSTKEISQLTGQGSNAIEAARSRLRKKLGLTDQDINLVAFLSRI